MERLKHIIQLNILLGAWLIAAPFVLGYAATRVDMANDVAVGVLLIACSSWMLTALPLADWCPWVQMLGGLWLIATPFAQHYAQLSRPFSNDIVVGIFSILVSATATWMLHSRVRKPA